MLFGVFVVLMVGFFRVLVKGLFFLGSRKEEGGRDFESVFEGMLWFL